MTQRICVLLFVLGVSLSSASVICQAESQTFLTRHTRDAVVNGTAPLLGHLPASQSLRFDVVLALRHQPELLNFLNDIYDPSSPNFRHYVTPAEFTRRFGPSQEDFYAVLAFAKANGIAVTGGSRDSMDIQMKGTVGAVERAFHVQINLYGHPTENRTFFAIDREPTVDLPIELELPQIEDRMRDYADRPVDFADATLVNLAARERLSTILTVDHDDFETYRLPGRKKFTIVPRRD